MDDTRAADDHATEGGKQATALGTPAPVVLRWRHCRGTVLRALRKSLLLARSGRYCLVGGRTGRLDDGSARTPPKQPAIVPISCAMEGNYRPQDDPPFLPLRLYAERPDEQMDYYQLFAGCMLDVEFFRPGDRYERWITDFLEADNRTLCLLPRFRRDVGPGGLDALYGKGYVLAQLRDDKVREFLLGFYAYLAWNLDHETFISRETNVLYTSDLHVRSAYPVPDMSDPVPCSSAVALHFLRHMLATEQSDRPEAPPDQLLLFPAVPRSWLADGKRLRVEGLPTAFGPVFVSLQSAVAAGRITVDVVPPKRAPPAIIKLRLRHPDSRPLQSVTVNGLPWSDFDPRQEWILLRQPREALHIVAQY